MTRYSLSFVHPFNCSLVISSCKLILRWQHWFGSQVLMRSSCGAIYGILFYSGAISISVVISGAICKLKYPVSINITFSARECNLYCGLSFSEALTKRPVWLVKQNQTWNRGKYSVLVKKWSLKAMAPLIMQHWKLFYTLRNQSSCLNDAKKTKQIMLLWVR